MSVSLQSDLSKFTAALRAVKSATKKDEADIVNKALKDVGFRAASFTPKADLARIDRDLRKDNLLAKLATAKLVRERGRGNFTARDHNLLMRKIRGRRRSGAGYHRAGWIPGIQQAGGTYRGAKLFPRGKASEGNAKMATTARLYATIENVTDGIQKVGSEALRKAIRFVAEDRAAYARKKIAANLRSHSDK